MATIKIWQLLPPTSWTQDTVFYRTSFVESTKIVTFLANSHLWGGLRPKSFPILYHLLVLESTLHSLLSHWSFRKERTAQCRRVESNLRGRPCTGVFQPSSRRNCACHFHGTQLPTSRLISCQLYFLWQSSQTVIRLSRVSSPPSDTALTKPLELSPSVFGLCCAYIYFHWNLRLARVQQPPYSSGTRGFWGSAKITFRFLLCDFRFNHDQRSVTSNLCDETGMILSWNWSIVNTKENSCRSIKTLCLIIVYCPCPNPTFPDSVFPICLTHH